MGLELGSPANIQDALKARLLRQETDIKLSTVNRVIKSHILSKGKIERKL